MKYIYLLLADITVDPTGKVSAPGYFQGTPFEVFRSITNLLLYITGAVAVLMVIVGGLRYVLSGGNPQATKSAKDTILYAVIGVLVAALGYAIVNFVLGRVIG